MARKIINLGNGDRLEIMPPEDNMGANFERGWYISAWKSYTQQPNRDESLLWKATYPRIGEAKSEIMANLARVSPDGTKRHRAEVEEAIDELAKHDKVAGAEDVDRSGCPREMFRQDYARGKLNSKAPVYDVIKNHLPGCKPCSDEDQLWRSESKKKKRFGIF